MHARVPDHAQSGFAALLMVSILATLFLSLYSVLTLAAKRGQQETQAQQRLTYLRQAAAALRDYYARNTAAMDGSSLPQMTPEQMLQGAGVQARWGLRLAYSSKQNALGGAIQYRDLYLWIPARNPDPTTLDAGANQFNPGPGVQWAKVNGLEIQQAVYNQAENTLTRLAQNLERMFRARIEADPLHDVAVNYWQAKGCSSSAGGEIPCTNNSYVPAKDLGLAQVIGADAGMMTDPWGGNVLVSNTLDANQLKPPYSLALRIVTPWGSNIDMTAVEPL